MVSHSFHGFRSPYPVHDLFKGVCSHVSEYETQWTAAVGFAIVENFKPLVALKIVAYAAPTFQLEIRFMLGSDAVVEYVVSQK